MMLCLLVDIGQNTSSQGSESLNSLFKEFGTIKQEMITWNIYELMT